MKLSDSFGQSIDFDIDPKYKKIGVNLSGGADSSILFYMVCNYLKENNRTDTSVSALSCANDLKHRWNVRKAADVINFTIDNLEFNPIDTHYSYYRDFQNVEYFHAVEQQLVIDGRIDLIISGVTSNPIVNADVVDSMGQLVNLNETGLAVRNTDGKAKTTHGTDAGHGYYTPFINTDKRFVAAMYDHYGVRDGLLPLTRSCEATPEPGASYDPEFEKTPCGDCWWCLERKWAFGTL